MYRIVQPGFDRAESHSFCRRRVFTQKGSLYIPRRTLALPQARLFASHRLLVETYQSCQARIMGPLVIVYRPSRVNPTLNQTRSFSDLSVFFGCPSEIPVVHD